MSNSLQLHGLQHARHPCPSLSPGICSNCCPLIESVMLSNHFILCHPFLLLPSIFPSIKVVSNESVLRIRWPKYCSFSISPSDEYSSAWFSLGLTGLNFLLSLKSLSRVSQGTLKSILQHHSSKWPKFSSLVLSLLYGPAVTFTYDYQKSQSS